MSNGRNPVSINNKKERSQGINERMATWQRRKQSSGVDWRDVSATSLRCALQSALAGNVAVMFSAAAGGTGVCVTLFDDGSRVKEYLMLASDVEAYLDAITEAYSSGAEDVRQSMAGGAD